jgi:hypothetical protein
MKARPAADDHRSLSSLIEKMLTDYLRSGVPDTKEAQPGDRICE